MKTFPCSARGSRTVRMLCPLVLLLAGAPAAAGAVHLGGVAPDRPDEPGFAWLRESFTCAPVDTLTVGVAWRDTVHGDTSGGTNAATTYACRAWTEDGPELTYRLEVAETTELVAVLSDLGGIDLDLVLLTTCDTDACVAQENTGFVAVLDPGTYILVVDGYDGDAGPFTLTFAGSYPGVPPQVCEAGGATPLDLVAPSHSVDGDLFGKPNEISAYPPCSDVAHLGGEDWFALTVPADSVGAHRRIAIVATGQNAALDLALWLFDGCGPDATCLDFADAGVGGTSESLELESAGDTARIVYLAVDALRSVTEGGGAYTLQANTTLPVESRSWGDVRTLFR